MQLANEAATSSFAQQRCRECASHRFCVEVGVVAGGTPATTPTSTQKGGVTTCGREPISGSPATPKVRGG
ncbi:MAG: hypothetical protein JOZ18_11140 [Chloroflexi bacterium]|nr:hypothetical protein [Chloroflexota bacterium]